jgi:hypothetical protein
MGALDPMKTRIIFRRLTTISQTKDPGQISRGYSQATAIVKKG